MRLIATYCMLSQYHPLQQLCIFILRIIIPVFCKVLARFCTVYYTCNNFLPIFIVAIGNFVKVVMLDSIHVMNADTKYVSKQIEDLQSW